MEANGYRFAWYNITLTDATAPDYQTGLERLAESGDIPRRPGCHPPNPPGNYTMYRKSLLSRISRSPVHHRARWQVSSAAGTARKQRCFACWARWRPGCCATP